MKGVVSMYLTIDSIKNLNSIISELNNMEDENKKQQFLSEHIEDTDLFLETISKINKKKFSSKNRKTQNQRKEDLEKALYNEEEIYAILCEKSNVEIMKEFSLADLKKMYASVYNRTATSSYTKERIVSVLRNRMHTMKRAEAFALVTEEREKKKVQYY